MADISDDLLTEFAKGQLGAIRCSGQYLDALRVVLGNQAHAEGKRYRLELNIRTQFAPERVMRTIIDQLKQAKITHAVRVSLGKGRTQFVQRYYRCPYERFYGLASHLEPMLRAEEASADKHLQSKVWTENPAMLFAAEEVPY